MKRQQRENFGFSRSNSDKFEIQRNNYQQNFPTRSVRSSNVLQYSLPAAIYSVNRMQSRETSDNKSSTDGNISMSELLNSNKKNVAKFYCDIEAALAGELSDVEDSEEQTVLPDRKSKKLSSGNVTLRMRESLAKETVSLVEEQLRKDKQLEGRVVRYPNAKPLALNVIHKVYVIRLEGAYAWVRLYDGKRPPCFDASDVVLNATQSLEWMELFPGTPCVVLTRLNPLDMVNDGIARERTEFESYARAVIEECHETTQTVTVRLVDFGFRLTELDVAAIKPLTVAFDGPPLAFRLQIDLLPKQQKGSLYRYATLGVRLTATREKQFLCWRRTWKTIDVKKQNWNIEKSDRSSSTKSFEMNNLNGQHRASSCFGLVTRVFVSSWLNKEHKSAGGRGIEAALCGIAERHSD
ncbi:unnamed protein product [Litomosoides sigmodontis]|uniref:Uncharacterized protein n=1 Tax=Litomosoides sigmodontis TaxID=42156 RepID=A0A3P6TUG3_LITSI|nr:unnamed protein product [Litomosoides sigmodontis]